MKKSLIFSITLLFLSVLFVFVLVFSRTDIVVGSPSSLPHLACGPCPEGANCFCAAGIPSYSLGFSDVNLATARALGGFSPLMYKLSKYLGYLVFLVPVGLTIFALLALRKSKSYLRLFLPLLFLYFATALVYIGFEFIPVNYRPLDLGEGLESSFPSSHTLFATVICASAVIFIQNYPFLFTAVKDFLPFLKIALYLLLVLVVTTRLLSGVHWFTDILGGLLFATTLLSFFFTFLPPSPKSAPASAKKSS